MPCMGAHVGSDVWPVWGQCHPSVTCLQEAEERSDMQGDPLFLSDWPMHAHTNAPIWTSSWSHSPSVSTLTPNLVINAMFFILNAQTQIHSKVSQEPQWFCRWLKMLTRTPKKHALFIRYSFYQLKEKKKKQLYHCLSLVIGGDDLLLSPQFMAPGWFRYKNTSDQCGPTVQCT